MDKDRLREVIIDQKDFFNQPKQLIERNIDLGRFIQTGQVVIISGIRRCGKSSLLYLIKEKMGLAEADYCYFSLDDERIIPEVDILEQVYLLHIEMYGKEPVFFFDEIQNVAGWEKFINRFYEKGSKIFVTGSNAYLLSSEISTSLTGRNRVLELFPFSFSEYLHFTGKSYDTEKLGTVQKALLQKDFDQYLKTGGFPLVVKENDLELINGYFQDILYRDIISRYRLSQVNEIRQIGLYFASNTGKLFSYSTLQKFSGIKSLSTIKDYLWYYEQSFLFFYLKKFDYSVKKQVMNPKKVYAIDPAISGRLGFNFSENRGRILENLVFLELIRRGKEVYYHAGRHECDFLIKEGLKVTEAIQICWALDPLNYDREIKGLREAMQLHHLDAGLLIVTEVSPALTKNKDNIKIIHAWKWLLEG
jgi:predicted AAA+ superfamily ATPase